MWERRQIIGQQIEKEKRAAKIMLDSNDRLVGGDREGVKIEDK